MVLLVGAGLFLRTLENLKSVDVGFDSRNLLMFNVNPGVNRYDPARSAQVFRQVLERMSSLPGVTATALTRTTLLSGSTSTSSMWTQGQTSQTAAEENMYMMDVSPAFFATLGIPVQRGRAFTDHDGTTAPKVAILNEAAARKLFADGDALGRRIGDSFEKSGEFEIVGVVRDTKYSSVRDPGPPTMYRCVWQQPVAGPERRAQDGGRSAGDDRDRARRDARGRPDAAAPAVHVADRADLAAVRAGAALRHGLRRVRRAGRGAGVHRPVRPHELQRRAPDHRDRRPHGARRAARHRGRAW